MDEKTSRFGAGSRILDVLQVGNYLLKKFVNLGISGWPISQEAGKPCAKICDLNVWLQRFLVGLAYDQARYGREDEHTAQPLFENEQGILRRLFLDYRKSHQVPVHLEV